MILTWYWYRIKSGDHQLKWDCEWVFFRISKTQNLSIDLNIKLYVSVIALYDEDTVSTVRVEIWKENIFSFFYHFVKLPFIFCFHLLWHVQPLPHIFSNKKVDHNYIVYVISKPRSRDFILKTEVSRFHFKNRGLEISF